MPVDDAATARQKEFIVKNGLLPRGASLRKVLNRIEFDTYSRVLIGAGLKPEHFTRYRPWLATVVVGLAYVHRRDLTMLRGVDDEIIEQAQAQGKELRYLEAIEDQMKLLVRGDDSRRSGRSNGSWCRFRSPFRTPRTWSTPGRGATPTASRR